MMQRRGTRGEQAAKLPDLGDLDAEQWRAKFWHVVDLVWPAGRSSAKQWAVELAFADHAHRDKLIDRDEERSAARIVGGPLTTVTLIEARNARALERAEESYRRLRKRRLDDVWFDDEAAAEEDAEGDEE